MLTIVRESLVFNVTNPGIAPNQIAVALPDSIANSVTGIGFCCTSGFNPVIKTNVDITMPFGGKITAMPGLTQLGNKNIGTFELDTFYAESAIYDTEIEFSFKDASNQAVVVINVPMQIHIPVSTAPPEILSGIETGNTLNITGIPSSKITNVNPAVISGTVSASTAEVYVNGTLADLIDEVTHKRYFAMGVPLGGYGTQTLDIEARGEGYLQGDTSVVSNIYRPDNVGIA